MGVNTFPVATGGSAVTQKVQEFTSTGTFTVPSNCTTVEVFLVGGGGGGGGGTTFANNWSAGGGGGGGGVLQKTITVTAGSSYTVTIGAGGAAGTSGSVAGSVGSDTTFGSLATGYGGGGGSSFHDNNATMAWGTVRATAGSAGWGAAQFGTTSFCSAAGGAGGNAYSQSASTNNMLANNSTSTTSTLQGGGSSGIQAACLSIGGVAIFGYGGGATSGSTNNGFNGKFTLSASNAGKGAWNDTSPSNNTGGAATANFGGGGGGGLVWATTANQNASGGAGGSGYARITYWS
jgi:hypothetical protein